MENVRNNNIINSRTSTNSRHSSKSRSRSKSCDTNTQSNTTNTNTNSNNNSDSDSDTSSDSDNTNNHQEQQQEHISYKGHNVILPGELIQQSHLLRNIITPQIWENLKHQDKETLEALLPKEEPDERQETLKRLFNWESFHFGSPLRLFQRQLKIGYFKPELQKGRSLLNKAEARRRRHQRKLEWYKMMQEVLVCRERLLTSAGSLPPGAPLPRISPPAEPPYPSAPKALYHRTRCRYFQELSSIKSAVCGDNFLSDDENYPEGPPSPRPSIKKRHISDIKNQSSIHSTLGTTDLTMPKFSDEWRRKVLSNHRKRKCYQPEHPELLTNGITLESFIGRTHFNNSHLVDSVGGRLSPGMPAAPHRPRRFMKQSIAVSPSISHMNQRPPSSISMTDSSDSENEIFEPIISISNPPPIIPQPTVTTSIPSVTIKVETKTVDEKVSFEETNVELVQATHSCFFSVLRDLVCSTPRQCMPLLSLTASLRTWRQNPIAPLNHWYSLTDDWVKTLPSAVAFLTGEIQAPDDFVPYLQYKPTTQVYQWIGAGRDSDSLLVPLCTYWLAHRQLPTVAAPPPVIVPQMVTVIEPNPSTSVPQLSTNKLTNRWQLSTSELESFRIQEKERFFKPHRAFTYRLPKGDAVVGPLRGVYASEENPANRVARGHTLLCPERPRHVTLLSLVRDAVACLPNGEGTRAHITSLLRRSQYLVADANEQTLQAAVSGALDRMHCVPDPCVKYVPSRKLWIYLHRERTEEEFERLHAENQIQGKLKAAALAQQKRSGNMPPAKPRSKPKPPNAVANKPLEMPTTADAKMTSLIVIPSGDVTKIDPEGDDVNIDVESSIDAPIITIPVSLSSQTVSTVGGSISTATISPTKSVGLSTTPVSSSAPQMISQQILTNSERKNMIYSAVSGTSLLQPRAKVLSHAVIRQSSANGTKNIVRLLNSSATSGKSLISPRALQQSTPTSPATRPQQIQTKLLVQRAGTAQTPGTLSPVQQRLLLESLMQHQRTHGQPMTHDQLLQTIQTSQKLSTSTVTTQATAGKATTTVSQQTIQLAGQTVQLPSGQTVQLTSQGLQLTGQTGVQLAGQTMQTVQLSGQTVQLGGQTVHLGNQTIQLAGQSIVRPGSDTSGRLTVQRQNSPLVAKILTNAQLRGANPNVGNRQLRLTNLSLAQLQGKPVLLHTSSNNSSEILLQASNLGAAQNATERVNTPTTQSHTLLLSNLGGQVVRVASGGGTLLGSTLRLQAANANSNSPVRINRGTGTTGVILQGGQTLKLQSAPIRIQQNSLAAGSGAPAGSRVLLTSGTRLQGLKLLPVQQTMTKGAAPIGSRQVYARIVSPSGTALNTAASGTATVMSGANILNIGLRNPNPTVPVTQQSTSK